MNYAQASNNFFAAKAERRFTLLYKAVRQKVKARGSPSLIFKNSGCSTLIK